MTSLRPSPHWRQQFTCPTIHVWKHSCFFGPRVHQFGCEFHLFEALELSFVFYGLVLPQWRSVPYGKKECHYVTTQNSNYRCRANHEASLCMQIIRVTYSWVEHSGCDISPSHGFNKSRRNQYGPKLRLQSFSLEAAVWMSSFTRTPTCLATL
ncbi:hypothetical protein PoB_007322800 [Plakobranchus ocellatus]|uniref:Uncharacterized protein n=1 Tax=Plakobranchus ocellatus TaxID=259542 RepID=A0AAV4DQY7_9GAST|nr:hypothetical protein PoB_007322800 [Plakobranchus ocellatus]